MDLWLFNNFLGDGHPQLPLTKKNDYRFCLLGRSGKSVAGHHAVLVQEGSLIECAIWDTHRSAWKACSVYHWIRKLTTPVYTYPQHSDWKTCLYIHIYIYMYTYRCIMYMYIYIYMLHYIAASNNHHSGFESVDTMTPIAGQAAPASSSPLGVWCSRAPRAQKKLRSPWVIWRWTSCSPWRKKMWVDLPIREHMAQWWNLQRQGWPG